MHAIDVAVVGGGPAGAVAAREAAERGASVVLVERHSEFSEPGMYDIALVERNLAMRALLWNPERIVPALYESGIRPFSTTASMRRCPSMRVMGSTTIRFMARHLLPAITRWLCGRPTAAAA